MILLMQREAAVIRGWSEDLVSSFTLLTLLEFICDDEKEEKKKKKRKKKQQQEEKNILIIK